MNLGTKLGPYEILAPIGAGGMGEVYKARDTRLDRTVAVKVLPSHIAAREDLRARFEREARAVSSLNHPHICSLFDVGQQDGVDYIVLEHLDGETLFDRLQRGPLPLDQALKYAMQIADAVDRAHRSGVVHRDLKPGNIMLTRDGAKVLDFGLAKTAPKSAADGATMTMALTSEGTMLGTPQYMSPEQISGSEADARSDIFAFGCVLYEMITGKRAFDGKTRVSVIGAILAAEPPPMSTLQPVTPHQLERTVARCLAKDPEDRWQSLRDVLLELRSITDAPAGTPVRTKRWWVPWAVAAALFAALAITNVLWLRTQEPEVRPTQFLVDPPRDTQFTNQYGATAISPDGRYLVFGAGTEGTAPLWLRPLDSVSARPLQGSEGGNLPFWSPDSRWVLFFADGKLKRSDIVGGAPQVLCDASVALLAQGAAWSRDGIIVFSGTEGLMRVPASGGVPQQITQRDTERKELGHGLPQFLPDGKRLLYFIVSGDPNLQGIYATSLDNPKERVKILATERKAYYVPSSRAGRTGFLVWMRDRTLLAQPFDAERLRLEGDATPVAEDVAYGLPVRAAFWTSDAGLLVYRTGEAARKHKLVWMSREGKRLGEAVKEDRYGSFKLSPDGSRVAVSRSEDGDHSDIWVFEFGRAVMTRLTFDSKRYSTPVWSPDGRQIAFSSYRNEGSQIYRKDAGGGGREEQLTTVLNPKFLSGWTPDGRYILYSEIDPKTGFDLWALPLEGDRKPVAVLQSPFNDTLGTSSPDGKWIAYASDASGRAEIYVRAFPASGDPWQVSNDGGSAPRWRADGKELFYVGLGRNSVMAAGVRVEGSRFQSDTARELFPMLVTRLGTASSFFEVTRDGQRFLMLEPASGAREVVPLTVVLNWQAALKK